MTLSNETNKKRIAIVSIALIMSLIFTTPSALANTNSTVAYDANGNRISGFGFYFEYNDFNQLARVRNGTANGNIVEEYTYDANGNRVMKYEPQKNQTTYYIDKSFIRIINSSGTFDTVYYYESKDLIARYELWHNKTFFYHPDHLGSTSIITNATGAVVEETTYEPFGRVASGGGDRYQYTGKELDPGTGLEYYGARYYDPSKASQFISPDSIISDPYNPQALNRYSYVLNNPYKYTDESGNVAILVVVLIALEVADYIEFSISANELAADPTNTDKQVNLALSTASVGGGSAISGTGILNRVVKAASKYVDKAADLVRGADRTQDGIKYVERTGRDPKAMSNFLKQEATKTDAVQKYGTQGVDAMKQGNVPPGYQVHHKQPLYAGGDNNPSNLEIKPVGGGPTQHPGTHARGGETYEKYGPPQNYKPIEQKPQPQKQWWEFWK